MIYIVCDHLCDKEEYRNIYSNLLIFAQNTWKESDLMIGYLVERGGVVGTKRVGTKQKGETLDNF